MTIRDIFDQVDVQGYIRVQEVTCDGIKVLYSGRYLNRNVERFDDKAITYIYPEKIDGVPWICIEVK